MRRWLGPCLLSPTVAPVSARGGLCRTWQSTASTGWKAAVQAPPGMTVSATQHPNVEGGSERILHPREVEDAPGSGIAGRNAEAEDTV
jgi:hypothetical protein